MLRQTESYGMAVIGRRPETEELAPEDERQILSALLECEPEHLHLLDQVHGPDSCFIAGAAADAKRPRADALYTTIPGEVLIVRTADCLPVFVYLEGMETRIVALIHAGWRGLAAGVISSCLQEMMARLPVLQKVEVAFGPAISQEAYEVGREVAEKFEKIPAAVRRANSPGKYWLDLKRVARSQFPPSLAQGAHWHRELEACTFRDGRFYSHRRGHKGRNYQAIWLEERRAA